MFFQTKLLERNKSFTNGIMVPCLYKAADTWWDTSELQILYLVTTVFRWHAERAQWGDHWGEKKEQGKQELIENKTTCPKEIISCQCETKKKINLSFVKSKINGDRKQWDCSGRSSDWKSLALSAAKGRKGERETVLNRLTAGRDSHRHSCRYYDRWPDKTQLMISSEDMR